MSLCNREASVCLSVRPSVCKLCANRYFYHRNGWIATKLAYDGPQKSPHPGCAQGQGQGQRSRDTGTSQSVMSRNVCYTVRSHVLSLHALTLLNTIILSFQYKYQAATPSLTVWFIIPQNFSAMSESSLNEKMPLYVERVKVAR